MLKMNRKTWEFVAGFIYGGAGMVFVFSGSFTLIYVGDYWLFGVSLIALIFGFILWEKTRAEGPG